MQVYASFQKNHTAWFARVWKARKHVSTLVHHSQLALPYVEAILGLQSTQSAKVMNGGLKRRTHNKLFVLFLLIHSVSHTSDLSLLLFPLVITWKKTGKMNALGGK